MSKKIMLSTLCAALLGASINTMAAEDHGFSIGIDYGRTEAKK